MFAVAFSSIRHKRVAAADPCTVAGGSYGDVAIVRFAEMPTSMARFRVFRRRAADGLARQSPECVRPGCRAAAADRRRSSGGRGPGGYARSGLNSSSRHAGRDVFQAASIAVGRPTPLPRGAPSNVSIRADRLHLSGEKQRIGRDFAHLYAIRRRSRASRMAFIIEHHLMRVRRRE